MEQSSRSFISVQIIICEVMNMGHFQKYQKTDKMEDAVCGPSVRLLEQAVVTSVYSKPWWRHLVGNSRTKLYSNEPLLSYGHHSMVNHGLKEI